jgi:hypothetical protein
MLALYKKISFWNLGGFGSGLMAAVRKTKLEAPPLTTALAVVADLCEYWLFGADYTLILAKRNPSA